MGEDGLGNTGSKVIAGKSDDRNPGEETVNGGGVAVDRVSIEGQVSQRETA